MKHYKEDLHELLQHTVAQRLRRQGYPIVIEDVPYNSNGYVGQIDVLAYRHGWEFHEMKCGDNKHSRNKAKEQYQRARLALPWLDLEGYLHTMTKTQRLSGSLDDEQ